MNVDVTLLIQKLKTLRAVLNNDDLLSEDDDETLAITIAVLETIEEEC